jgi:hypothetical protein
MDGPKIYEDIFVYQLLTASEHECVGSIYCMIKDVYPDTAASSYDKQVLLNKMMQESADVSGVFSRAHYVEEKLLELISHGARQYVFTGAGMYNFVLRCSDPSYI